MSVPTNTRAIKAAIKAAIVAINPSFDFRAGTRWEPVEETGSEGLRRFWLFIDAPAGRVKDAGQKVWGVVEHWSFQLVIRVGYGDLPIDGDDLRGDLVTSDNVDLDKALRDLIGQVDGLIKVDDLGPEVIRDGDRWTFVEYRYEVGYFQEGT